MVNQPDAVGSSAATTSLQQSLISYNSQGLVGVTITAQNVTALLPTLEGTNGFQLAVSLPADHEATGYISVGQLGNVTELVPRGLLGVVADYKPITDQVGTFNDQAVNVLEADRVTATPANPSNITGAGSHHRRAQRQLQRPGRGGHRRGRRQPPGHGRRTPGRHVRGQRRRGPAMLQLAHHVAPGAAEDFATADFGGDAGFASNIQALANAGAR